MAIARCKLVDQSKCGVYHLINRCVRRGFLLGHECDHRRDWLQYALREKTAIFAIDVLAYAIMNNHFHLIVKTHPERAAAWSAMEVAQRWLDACPPKDLRGQAVRPGHAELEALIAQPGWVEERRKRLASMSWLMKLIKEKLARQANKEDNVRGHFWEGRFTSVPLLDEAAVIAGMVYVDLNPIRARIAETPEESDHTSVQERIVLAARIRTSDTYLPRKARRAALQAPDAERLAEMRREVLARQAGKAVKPWVAAIKECAPGSEGQCRLTLEQYLELVDLTARRVRQNKRGAMDNTLAPILERLGLDTEKWLEAMGRGGRFRGRAVGSQESRARHIGASAAGVKWIADKTPLYAGAARVGAVGLPVSNRQQR